MQPFIEKDQILKNNILFFVKIFKETLLLILSIFGAKYL